MYLKCTYKQRHSRIYITLSINRYVSKFLLVSLNIDAILQETTIYHKQQKLDAMTDGLGLGDAYSATLSRIKGQGGRKSVAWYGRFGVDPPSERPLKPSDLCHALAVEIGSPNLNSDNAPSTRTVLDCCQGPGFSMVGRGPARTGWTRSKSGLV